MWGDDAKYNLAGDKIIVIVCNPLLQGGSSNRFPLVSLREHLCLGMRSLRPVLEILAWSWNVLFSGIHPSKDLHNGVYRGKYRAGSRIAGSMGAVNKDSRGHIPPLNTVRPAMALIRRSCMHGRVSGRLEVASMVLVTACPLERCPSVPPMHSNPNWTQLVPWIC